MRFEAKHSYLKKLTQNIGNFINLPYTLALQHQKLQCYHGMNQSDYSSGIVSHGPGMHVTIHIHIVVQILHFNCSPIDILLISS